jgi:hypothetical protein
MNDEQPRSGAQPGEESALSASAGPPATAAHHEAPNARNVASEGLLRVPRAARIHGTVDDIIACSGERLGGSTFKARFVVNGDGYTECSICKGEFLFDRIEEDDSGNHFPSFCPLCGAAFEVVR